MALRGDPPKGQSEFTAIKGGFRYANELVGFIKREFPNFGIGVAGYPEKHVEAPNLDVDMDNLKRKLMPALMRSSRSSFTIMQTSTAFAMRASSVASPNQSCQGFFRSSPPRKCNGLLDCAVLEYPTR